MITAWAISVFLICFQLAADAPTAEPGPTNQASEQETQEAIERSIKLLDSDSFQTRENAVKELWSYGEQAKPALLEVAETGSLEASGRARRILADIDLGITPHTPVARSTALRQFQSSTQAQRAVVVSEMLSKGEMELAAKLIDRIDEPIVKMNLFRQSFNSTPIMTKLIESRKFEWWIQKASEHNASIRRHEVIAQWLRRNDTLRQLRDNDNLSIIEDLFAQEPHDASRFTLAKTLLTHSTFLEMFAKEPNIDLLLRLIDLPTNPAGSNELLLMLIHRGDASTICQAETFRKLMRFAEAKAPANIDSEIKPAFLKRFSSTPGLTEQLSTDTLIELLTGLTAADFERSLETAIGQSSFALWILEVDHFRPLLDWAKGLPATARDPFVVRLGKLIETNRGAADRALNDPSTLELYWQLIGAIANEDDKRDTKFSLAAVLGSEPHFRSEQRKELSQLILATQTTAADAALSSLLRNSHYRERIFDQGEDVRAHLNRCAQFDIATGEKSLTEAYQNILLANALRQYMAVPINSHWILQEYLPSLSDSKRQVAIDAMCNSERLLQTWKETPAIEQLLGLATEQVDPIARASNIASVLRHEQFGEMEADDPKLRLLSIYRDESLPDAARVAFIQRLATNQTYLEWLNRNDRVTEFVESVENLAAKPDADLSSLIFSTGYIRLISQQNRLESWLAGLEGDAVAESRALSVMIRQQDLLTPDFLDRNMERLIRIANAVEDTYQRGNYLATVMLSPNSLLMHQQKQSLGDLLQQIGSQNHLHVQGALLRSLARPEVMKVFAESGELDALVEMIKDLPLNLGPSALSMIVNPVLLKHLADTGQVDFLFEMVSRDPGRSNLQSNRMVIDMLINHGYVDRLLETAENSKEREALTARLVSSSDAIAFYMKKGRLTELVKLFERLEPGMNRDNAVMSLFKRPELAGAVLKEIGTERSLAIVNTIQYPFYLSSARVNALVASCEIEKLPEPMLRQLLVDLQSNGVVSADRCQNLLEGAAGEQFIAAGLLPQIREIFLKAKRPSEKRETQPLDPFYSSILVMKHLSANGQMEEFVQHAKSISEPQDVTAFAQRSLDSDEGCRILLRSANFKSFASIIETMSEYYQSHFWRSFCTNRNVIHYVSHADDVAAMFGYLIEREQSASEIEHLIIQIAQDKQLDQIVLNRNLVNHLVASLPKLAANTKASLASHLSRHSSAIWTMVESGQWDAFVAIIECEQTEELRKQRWRSCAGPYGGLISALIIADQDEKVADVLQKSSDSAWDLAWTDLWLRSARGTLEEDIKKQEAIANILTEAHWRWLAWAYRAQGNNAKATEAAINANGHMFRTALAIERGDWTQAAALLSDSAAPQSHIQPQGIEESELEHQAMLLVTRLYAQQHDQLHVPIDAIHDLRAKTNNLRVRSRCCDALLLGEQFESALSFMDQKIIHRALRLRLHRGEYAGAIGAVSWDSLNPQAFLTKIRTSTGNDSGAMQSTAELLSALSNEQKHHDMQLLHEAVIESQLENTRGMQPNHHLINYASQLYRYELYDLFWPTLEHMNLLPLMDAAVLYDDSQDEVRRAVRSYLTRWASRATGKQVETSERQAAIAAVRMVDEAIRLNSVPKYRLDEWVDKVMETSDRWKPQPEDALAVGIICLRQGRLEDARRVLLPLEQTHSAASRALARDAWQREDWSQAAIHYGRLNRKDRGRIETLYLSGLALSRSGKVREGEEIMTKAMKIAFHPVSQLQLAVELLELDEAELGKKILQAVVRSVPHHSEIQMEAIRHLKAIASSPEEVVKWCQQWQMLQARYVYGNGDQREFFQVPWTMHGAIAEHAFLDEDWPAVDRALRVCHEIKPRETVFFAEWIERLNQAGQTDLTTVWKEKFGVQATPND